MGMRRLSVGALEGEAAEPDWNGLCLVTIEIDKVLSATIQLAVVLRPPFVGEGALGGIGELVELGRSADESVLAVDRSVLKKCIEIARDVVHRNSGGTLSSRHIVVDGQDDFGWCTCRCCANARGKSEDGRGEDNGELHFEEKSWLVGWLVGWMSDGKVVWKVWVECFGVADVLMC